MGQGHFARVFRRDVYGSAEPHRRPFPIRLAGWQETRGQGDHRGGGNTREKIATR